MYRLWILLPLLVPVSLTQPASEASGQKAAGNLYFVAIGQQDNWKFLPEGFARVVSDQGKTLYREIHGRVLVGPKATKKELLDRVTGCATAPNQMIW